MNSTESFHEIFINNITNKQIQVTKKKTIA